MGTTVTIDLIQTAIYAAVAIGGYFVSHYNLLGSATPAPVTPSPTTTPTTTSPASSVLSSILPVFEQQLLAILQQGVKNMLATPAQAGGQTGSMPSQVATNAK